MTKIRVVIVDDEPLAREGIRSLVSEDPSLKIDCECRDGVEAIRFLEHHSTDILFLDIQMPELNGFEVLESIAPPPIIIFVTAFDKYAVDAFTIHAFDYLLKPIDPERFAVTLNRAKSALNRERKHPENTKLMNLLTTMRAHEHRPERLMIKSSGRIYFLNKEEIDWIEAAGDYVYIHVRGKKYLHRETMRTLEERLTTPTFSRIHRSTIVNTLKIKELQSLAHGEAILSLHDGTQLNVSRSYREHLLTLLS